MITKLSQLVPKASSLGTSRLFVAAADDLHTLEAVSLAAKQGIVTPTLIGDRASIEAIASERGVDIEGFEIIEAPTIRKSVEIAVRAVGEGRADIIMKGLVPTDQYMQGILSKEYGIVNGRQPVSHIVVLEFPGFDRLVLASDVAIIPYPDLKQKIALTNYLIGMAKALDIETPRLAVIAPSEQVLPSVVSSSEAAIIAKMADRGQISGAIIDGPLALDVALDEETVKIKRLRSEVAGKADCLLFPNIDSSNAFFKTATKLCKASLAGIVVGAKVPCILTSRGDSIESKMYSIAMASLLSKSSKR